MVVYMIGGVPLVLYALIIRPIANLYREPVGIMVSPLFGNYGHYLQDLFVISTVFITVSLSLYLVSVYRARHSSKGISLATLTLPIALYIFGYVLLGVSGL